MSKINHKIILSDFIFIENYDVYIDNLINYYVEQLEIGYQYLVLHIYKELYSADDINDDTFWYELSSNEYLSLDFIRVFKNDLHWDRLNTKEIYKHFDEFYNYIDMNNKNIDYGNNTNEFGQVVTEELIYKYPNLHYNWYKISRFIIMDNKFMHKFSHKIKWDFLYTKDRIFFEDRLEMIDYYKEYLIRKKNGHVTMVPEPFYDEGYESDDSFTLTDKKKIHKIMDNYIYDKNEIKSLVNVFKYYIPQNIFNKWIKMKERKCYSSL